LWDNLKLQVSALFLFCVAAAMVRRVCCLLLAVQLQCLLMSISAFYQQAPLVGNLNRVSIVTAALSQRPRCFDHCSKQLCSHSTRLHSTSAQDVSEQKAEALQSDSQASSAGTLLELGPALELAMNRALRGDSTVLKQIASTACEWRCPLGSYRGQEAIAAELRELGTFLSDPRYTVTKTETLSDSSMRVSWIASATWPLPWLPRIIVAGASTLSCSASTEDASMLQIQSINDEWQSGLLNLLYKHLVPGFWDAWNQFCSPQAERYPYKMIRKGRGYEVWQLAPRLVLRPSIIDRYYLMHLLLMLDI
jgi:hypothetical protein